ncbi:F0F1 ATP synthase subunit delta [Legionella dresdenensis]|uniref:ATP synthase subunit delta n=1 Tax=Legionella dresdenensis TaxID=450200 RepID=A0ABV8CD18_9GAMM
MADSTIIARPYAKAVFETALANAALDKWSEYLHALAVAVSCEEVTRFITNPVTTAEQHSELLFSTMQGAGAGDDELKNFIQVLAQNKRLTVLPEIVELYEAMKAEQEKSLTVNVSSYSELSDAQQQRLITSLSNRLQRQVTLEITIDKTLLGGAVISAGDFVIDGSVRGKLNKLKTRLAA